MFLQLRRDGRLRAIHLPVEVRLPQLLLHVGRALRECCQRGLYRVGPVCGGRLAVQRCNVQTLGLTHVQGDAISVMSVEGTAPPSQYRLQNRSFAAAVHTDENSKALMQIDLEANW